MNQNEAVFRDAPVRTAVVRMAVPTVISSLVLVIYNMADTFFVGQTHDAMQVAAVSLTNRSLSCLWPSQTCSASAAAR